MKAIFLFLCLLSPLLAKGPANDDFANAIRLSGKFPIKKWGTVTDKLDRFRATKEEGEPDHAGQKGHGSVWYTYSTKISRKTEISAVSQNMDLILAVYTGSSVNDLTLVHRYRNFAYPAFSRKKTEPLTQHARVEFNAKAGTKYYIAIDTENTVDKKNNRHGQFTILVKPSKNTLNPQLELLQSGSPWEYLLPVDAGKIPVDPKTLDPDFFYTWMFPKRYDGPTFKKGRAPFGYGDVAGLGKSTNLLGKRESATPPSGSRYTAYLRSSFTPPIDVSAIGIEGIIDDGAIIYLNGKEVGRINVSEQKNPQDWMTVANNSKLENVSLDELVQRIEIHNLNLPADQPVELSVSLHNAVGTSSDLGLDLRIYSLNPSNK